MAAGGRRCREPLEAHVRCSADITTRAAHQTVRDRSSRRQWPVCAPRARRRPRVCFASGHTAPCMLWTVLAGKRGERGVAARSRRRLLPRCTPWCSTRPMHGSTFNSIPHARAAVRLYSTRRCYMNMQQGGQGVALHGKASGIAEVVCVRVATRPCMVYMHSRSRHAAACFISMECRGVIAGHGMLRSPARNFLISALGERAPARPRGVGVRSRSGRRVWQQ